MAKINVFCKYIHDRHGAGLISFIHICMSMVMYILYHETPGMILCLFIETEEKTSFLIIAMCFHEFYQENFIELDQSA